METTGVVRFAMKIALVMMVAILINAAICATTGRWTLESFITGLEYAGFISILLGVSSVLGSLKARGLPGIQYASSVGPEGMHRRARRHVEELLGAYSHLILFGISGALLLVLAGIMAT